MYIRSDLTYRQKFSVKRLVLRKYVPVLGSGTQNDVKMMPKTESRVYFTDNLSLQLPIAPVL